MKGKAIIFSAPSGAGKTSIVHGLLIRMDNLAFSVSATSRVARGEERNGIDYWFLTPEEFKQKINHADFIEHEEVYTDQYYGTLKSEIERIWEAGKTVIFDVDVIGGLNLKKYFGTDALAIFVMPPNAKELEKRLRGRKTESEEKIQMRLKKSTEELSYADQFDLVLENKILDKAIDKAEGLINTFITE